MFYVDWDIYNKEKQDAGKKNIIGIDDDELIRRKIIKAVAVYIKAHREKATILLVRYGYDKTGNEEEIVTGIINQLYEGTKNFRDDLAVELIKLNLIDATAVPLAASVIVTGKIGNEKLKKDEQVKKIRQEILGAIAQEKSHELQLESKTGQVKTVVIAAISILIFIGLIYFLIKPQNNNQYV